MTTTRISNRAAARSDVVESVKPKTRTIGVANVNESAGKWPIVLRFVHQRSSFQEMIRPVSL
jgi:hypothetical protein